MALAQIQHRSPTSIGPAKNSNFGLLKLWLPVTRYAPCEMHTFDPILIRPGLSSQTSSPIQTLSPTSSSHGYLMLTDGLILRFFPTRAPNNLSSEGFQGQMSPAEASVEKK